MKSRRSVLGGLDVLVILTMILVGNPFSASAHGAATVGCTDVLADGDFEAGGAAWTQYSAGGYDLVSDFNPRTGQWGAYLGGVNNADDHLSQAIALPNDAVTITLEAWWSLTTEEDAGVFDWLTISLLGPDQTPLAELARVDNEADANVWTLAEAAMTPFAGQTVILRLAAQTDATNPTNFYLDDLRVIVCTGIPIPPSTGRVYLPYVQAAR